MACTISLTGHLGRDPEIKYLDGGRMVAKFTICAILPKVQGQDPEPMWFTVEVWGQAAEWIANNMQKGDRALVQGDLREDTWTDQATGEVKRASVIKRAQVEKQWAPLANARQVTPGVDPARPARQPAPAPVHQPAPPAQQGQQGWAPPAAAGAAGPARPAIPLQQQAPPWPAAEDGPPF